MADYNIRILHFAYHFFINRKSIRPFCLKCQKTVHKFILADIVGILNYIKLHIVFLQKIIFSNCLLVHGKILYYQYSLFVHSIGLLLKLTLMSDNCHKSNCKN